MKKVLIILGVIIILAISVTAFTEFDYEGKEIVKTDSTQSTYNELEGVSFNIPNGWTVDYLMNAWENEIDGTSGVMLFSPDFSTRIVDSVETITTGGRISVHVSNADLAEDLKDSEVYANHVNNNCMNCSDKKIVTVSGLPASYIVRENKSTLVQLYVNNKVVSFILISGEQSQLENYLKDFSSFLKSVKFTE